jgi:transposase
VDADSGLVHTVTTTAANEADGEQVGDLLHRKEDKVWADSGYRGAQSRVKRSLHARRLRHGSDLSLARLAPAGGQGSWESASKRGDAYLRTLLMLGARAVVIRSKDGPTWPWLTALLQRRSFSVAVAAIANKLARTI